MKVTNLGSNIFLVKFRGQRDLTHTFVRIQEYYESPHFKGRYFTISKFRHWYISNSPDGKKTGRFSFYQDLAGFNVPSHVLEPFCKGKFGLLTNYEKNLVSQFNDMKRKFYIIGTYGNRTKCVLKHEIGHALFYLNKKYRKKVLNIIHEIDKKTIHQIYQFLINTRLYHHEVLVDEVHAYILSSLDELKDEKIDISQLTEANQKMNLVFDKYYSSMTEGIIKQK